MSQNSSLVAEPMFEVFFDGECPLCRREIEMVRRLDRLGRLKLTDISDPGFDAKSYAGKSSDELMLEIHGRFLDSHESKERKLSNWVTGVEVFRQIYSEVGFVSIVRFSRFPVLDWLLRSGYRIFAHFRYRFAVARIARQECGESCSPSTNQSIHKEAV